MGVDIFLRALRCASGLRDVTRSNSGVVNLRSNSSPSLLFCGITSHRQVTFSPHLV